MRIQVIADEDTITLRALRVKETARLRAGPVVKVPESVGNRWLRSQAMWESRPSEWDKTVTEVERMIPSWV
jgi:hypothetical protein